MIIVLKHKKEINPLVR